MTFKILPCNGLDALIMDSLGNIYGSDFGSSTTGGSSVYKINTAGVISTYSTGYSSCNGLALDQNNNLYVVDFTSNANTHQVYKLDNLVKVSTKTIKKLQKNMYIKFVNTEEKINEIKNDL